MRYVPGGAAAGCEKIMFPETTVPCPAADNGFINPAVTSTRTKATLVFKGFRIGSEVMPE